MTAKTFNVLYVDAWSDGMGGWTWNEWHKVGTVAADVVDSFGYPVNARKALKWFRDAGHTSAASAGKLCIEDDGYNICVCRRDGSPLFAIEYGAE